MLFKRYSGFVCYFKINSHKCEFKPLFVLVVTLFFFFLVGKFSSALALKLGSSGSNVLGPHSVVLHM